MASPPQSAPAPAKIITPAIRQRLQERLNQARRLSRGEPCPHGQIDELLSECLIVDPGNTVYIGALLQHLRRSDRPQARRASEGKARLASGGVFPRLRFGLVESFARLFESDPLPPLRTAAAAADWEKVLTLAPPALCRQPKSVEILRRLATACAALEHEQAELCYLQAAVALAPSDAEAARQLARALTRQGLFDDAAIAWKRLAELLPEDEECRQTIKILCEYEPPPGRVGLLEECQVREIQSAVDAGTATMDEVRKLFDHLRGWHKFDEAQQLLDHAMGLFGPGLALLECREQLILDRSDRPAMLATQLGSMRTEYRLTLDRAMTQSVRAHLQVQYQRCERHPDDPALQLHLGQLLTHSGNYSEALKRLEPVAKVPELCARALQSLGFAWVQLKQTDKALKCYQESIEVAKVQGDDDLIIEGLDSAATIAESSGNYELARRYFAMILTYPPNGELRQIKQHIARTMLDNLSRVCQNS